MTRYEDPEGGFTKTVRRNPRRHVEAEPPHTLQEQLAHMRKQPHEEPLPPLDAGDLPPVESQEAVAEHERYTKHLRPGKMSPAAQIGLEAPYGYMEISADIGNGSTTCRIPMSKAQADAQMEHALVVQKVGLRKDRHATLAAICSTVLSVAALGAMILGGVAAIRKETGTGESEA